MTIEEGRPLAFSCRVLNYHPARSLLVLILSGLSKPIVPFGTSIQHLRVQHIELRK